MKYLSILILAFSMNLYGQVSLRGSMGINFMNTPSLKDYLNQNFAPQNEQLGSFGSAISFSLEGDYNVSKSFEIGIEAAYLLNSYTYSLTGGKYEFAYGAFMPSAIAYYVIKGTGYYIKFGAGGGPRFLTVNETLPFTVIANKYTSTGFGLLLKADGNTAISSNFYANIGADIRYDLLGEPKSGSNNIMNNAAGTNVNLNSFSVGIRLGLSYIF